MVKLTRDVYRGLKEKEIKEMPLEEFANLTTSRSRRKKELADLSCTVGDRILRWISPNRRGFSLDGRTLPSSPHRSDHGQHAQSFYHPDLHVASIADIRVDGQCELDVWVSPCGRKCIRRRVGGSRGVKGRRKDYPHRPGCGHQHYGPQAVRSVLDVE